MLFRWEKILQVFSDVDLGICTKQDVLSSYVKKKRNSKFCKSEFQMDEFSTAEFSKKNPTRIHGNWNEVGILLPMGVPEIRTKNQNSQPRFKQTLYSQIMSLDLGK